MLQPLKEELGEEIHNMVVEALTEFQEHTSSGSCELWNFKEKRKALLVEVIDSIFKLPVKPSSKLRKQSKLG